MKALIALVVAATALGLARANEGHKMLAGMSEPKRAEALAGLLKASGENCGRATRTFYRGSDNSGAAYWSVACTSGKSFQVQVKNDRQASTVVADCDVLRAAAKIDCWAKF